MSDTTDNDNAGAIDPTAWVTISLHPPSPNCHFAGFVVQQGDEMRAAARAVDFMALQEIPSDDDDDDAPAATRIVPIVIDWSGALIVCDPHLNNGFAAVAPSAAAAEEHTRTVIKALAAAAGAAAETPAAP